MLESWKRTKELSNKIKKVIVRLQIKEKSFVKISNLINIPISIVRLVYYKFEKKEIVKNLPYTGYSPSFLPF